MAVGEEGVFCHSASLRVLSALNPLRGGGSRSVNSPYSQQHREGGSSICRLGIGMTYLGCLMIGAIIRRVVEVVQTSVDCPRLHFRWAHLHEGSEFLKNRAGRFSEARGPAGASSPSTVTSFTSQAAAMNIPSGK